MSVVKKQIRLCEIRVDKETKEDVLSVLDSGKYVNVEDGWVTKFENDFAKYIGVKNAIAMSSGTAALEGAIKYLMAYKLIKSFTSPSLTFQATVSSVIRNNGTVHYLDVSDYYLPYDFRGDNAEDDAEILVHLYGNAAKKRHTLALEDCCQAHGAEIDGMKVGSMGFAGVFSFFPSKIMSVCGDGGMITTNDAYLAWYCTAYRNSGRAQGEKYRHDFIGTNARMSELSACIGWHQFQHIDEWIDKRRAIAKIYEQELSEAVITPPADKGVKHVYYVYTIRTPQRDALQEHLKNNGIQTGIYYPIPCHRQPPTYSNIILPNTERFCKEILSIPIHPYLTEEDVKYVCEKVKEFFR